MPFDDPLTYGDLLKRSSTPSNKLVHPAPRLCDRFQESVPGCGIETLLGRFMDDALPSGRHRSYPPNANHVLNCRLLAVGAAAVVLLIVINAVIESHVIAVALAITGSRID